MKYFNFNNEVDTVPVEVNETTKEVTFNGVTFASMQEFAEFYAQARDVKPEYLKNWVLVENGDTYSFVLRAATAGTSAVDIAIALRAAGFTPEEIAKALAGNDVQEDSDLEDDEFTEALEGYNVDMLLYGAEVQTIEQFRQLVENEIDEYDYDYSECFDSYNYEAKNKLRARFPEIPAEFAFAFIKGRLADSYQVNREAAEKAQITAQLAGRNDFQVYFISQDGAERRRVSNLRAFNQVYFEGNKVLVVI